MANNKTGELISQLKNRIGQIETLANEIGTNEANEIKDKAINILNRVANKFIEVSKEVISNEEYNLGYEFTEKKSEELFAHTMNKLNSLKPKEVKKDDVTYSEIEKFISDLSVNKEVKIEEKAGDVVKTELENKAVEFLDEWFSLKG